LRSAKRTLRSVEIPASSEVRVVIAARPAMRATLREAVGRAGMHLAADCVDASDLVAAVARERPDLCLLDRELRGGGLAATAAVAAPPRAPKVLIVGGRGSPAEVRAARLAGATDAVPADIDATALAAAASALVHQEKR
jgi:two-component system invasion response regulator UvrY